MPADRTEELVCGICIYEDDRTGENAETVINGKVPTACQTAQWDRMSAIIAEKKDGHRPYARVGLHPLENTLHGQDRGVKSDSVILS